MTYLEEYGTIRDRWIAEWTEEVPVQWENEKLPEGATIDPAKPWVRVTILPNDANLISVGTNGLHRHDGDIVVEISVPEGTGQGRALQLADRAMGIFRSWLEGELVGWSPYLVKVGARDGWYKINVICPYQRDERFANQ